ncbi:MAG: hypothetical protein E7214_14445 [Clostridium sp.]|nr:hypothetical protein [Clostridium sp.]
MIKKGLYIFLFISIVLNIFLIVNLKSTNKEENTTKSNVSDEDVEELYSVENISEDEKKRIAKDLCKEHIESGGIKFEYFGNVVDESSNRKAVQTFKNYRINDIKIVDENKNKFIAIVGYDIQCTDECKVWIAGAGTVGEDNWVIGKGYILTIEKYKNKYFITDVSY